MSTGSSDKTLAILGGGQLAQMLGEAAAPLGVKCRYLDPSPHACAARTCELVTGAFDDRQAVHQLLDGADALTFEFENIPIWPLSEANRLGIPVRPNSDALRIASDRLREKELFVSLGMDVPPYRSVSTEQDLAHAVRAIGCPLLLKSRSGGYDGRNQANVQHPDQALAAWNSIGQIECLAESRVKLLGEISVIAARSQSGDTAVYPLIANEHANGILVRSRSPAETSQEHSKVAQSWTAALLDRLGYVGVLALEIFITEQGLLANEFAPRVHNTGHLTIEANRTSQFENHVRAILGMDLGPCDALGHAVMRNVIGMMPPASSRLTAPGVFWHEYGKQPRRGRKLGHITLHGASAGEVSSLESLLDESLVSLHG